MKATLESSEVVYLICASQVTRADMDALIGAIRRDMLRVGVEIQIIEKAVAW